MPDAFSWRKALAPFADLKLYGFACMYFSLNLVSTALNYFLPIILESGMGFSSNDSILLSTPVRWFVPLFRSWSDRGFLRIVLPKM